MFETERDRYVAQFERFATNGGGVGPAWLRALRRHAIERFVELGFPTTRDEEWRYTNLARLLRTEFQHTAHAAAEMADLSKMVEDIAASRPRLVFVNGRFNESLSVTGGAKGMRAGSLAAVMRDDPGKLERHFGRIAERRDHSFLALNTAFFEDGALVEIDPNATLREPLYIVFITTAPVPIVVYPRCLIVADNGSEATVAEIHIGSGTVSYFINATTEIAVGENAVLRYHRVEREASSAFHVAAVQARVARNAHFHSCAFDFGGALVRNDLDASLTGEGSECTLDGLYVGSRKQHIDNHTRVDHLQPHCTSRELYKGILAGRARGVFNGKIYVHKAAQKTDASQANRNLLLSDNATINTKPQLEIFADDVKCSHGSTIGHLDDNALFYLRSRGIGRTEARLFLTYAFATEVVQRVKDDTLRSRLESLLMRELGSEVAQ